jgi:hypothetical protein
LVTTGVTIQGPGAGQLTVSGNNQSRVFEVNAPYQPVVLSGLTISNGNGGTAGKAGGILNDFLSTLTVSGCTISNNHVGGFRAGGYGGRH